MPTDRRRSSGTDQAHRDCAKQMPGPGFGAVQLGVVNSQGAFMQGADVLAAALRLRAVRAAGRFAWAGHSLLPASDSVRVSSARHVAALYADNGHHEDAAQVLRAAAQRAQGPAKRELDAARVQAQLDAGTAPGDLDDVLSATLRDADAALARSDLPAAASRLTDALAIAFHPPRHLLTDPPPLLPPPHPF